MSETQKARQAHLWDWTLGDRMKKALKVAGISRDDMAEYLGVAPATVSTWMNDRIHPSLQTQRLWAMRTGAGYDWITGYTPRDLNPEPTDSGKATDAIVTHIDLAPSLRLVAYPKGGKAA